MSSGGPVALLSGGFWIQVQKTSLQQLFCNLWPPHSCTTHGPSRQTKIW